MTKKPKAVTDAELAVLKVLWQKGPLSAKAITQEIYPDGAESEFASVHSFLQRLEKKGLVTRDRGAFVHLFSAVASRSEVAGRELDELASRLGDNCVAPMIMHLVERQPLNKQEAAEIKKLIDKYSK